MQPRQTKSYLKQLLEERGIRVKSKLGQNFLIDLNLIDLLLRAGDAGPEDMVLEVGSGTGSLTARLLATAGAVLSVEIDGAFHDLVKETLEPRDNLVLLRADILKNKNELNPKVLTALEELFTRSGCQRRKLIANLPYAVATPMIANFLLSDVVFDRMVVTVQWEIAERLMAEPDTRSYGALAILVQSLANVSLVRKLPPSVFWPRPEVESAIVMIEPDAGKREHVGDPLRFRRFLRELYVHRRKNLRGALVGMPSGRRQKQVVDEQLASLRIDGGVRAEVLDIEQHLRLCAAFGSEQ